MERIYSLFKEYYIEIDSLDMSGLSKGYIRVKDRATNKLYDFICTNRDSLPAIDKMINKPDRDSNSDVGLYYAYVTCANIDKALVRPDTITNEYPPIGKANSAIIACTLVPIGIAMPPVNIGMTAATSDSKIGAAAAIVYDKTPIIKEGKFDPDDKDAVNSAKNKSTGVLVGASSASLKGPGANSICLSEKAGLVVDADNTTTKTQESDHGGGMFTTSLNFLQHYLIGLGNAVALPMPHMVNLVKMVAVGKFIKDFVGKKGRRVDAGLGDGSTKWVAGTGVHGMADEIGEIGRSI